MSNIAWRFGPCDHLRELMSPTKPRLLRLEGRGSWDTTLPATSSTGAAMTEGAVRTDKQRVACSIGGALGALGALLYCLHLFHILFHGWPRGIIFFIKEYQPIKFYMYLYELVINSKKNEPFCFEVRVRLSVLCICSQPTLKRLMLVLVYLKLFSD